MPWSPGNEGPGREPAHEHQIRLRAYEIYRARREGEGDALSDWLQAEREFLAANAATAGRPQSTERSKRGSTTKGKEPRRGTRRARVSQDGWDLEPLETLIERRRRTHRSSGV